MSLQDIDPVMCFRKCLSSVAQPQDCGGEILSDKSLRFDLHHLFISNSSCDTEIADSGCCCICESVLCGYKVTESLVLVLDRQEHSLFRMTIEDICYILSANFLYVLAEL